ncbi:ATP-binding cassette domain-containing protein [Rhodococcus hoagii]|nr:ATP-binding cassette domain-containing protein [Prescottella equi]
MFNTITDCRSRRRGRSCSTGTTSPALARQAREPRPGPHVPATGTVPVAVVRDNIRVAGDIHRSNTRSRIDVDAETDRILELTKLTDVADKDVSDIPTGRARVVEAARALMTSPRLLLLDEPASGQTEQETEDFAELLLQLAADGLAICLVEHDIPLVMKLCKQIHVLDYGAVLASGSAEQVRDDPP